MAYEKFGKDRHRPSGEWVQTTIVEKVAGIIHLKHAVTEFAKAVKKAANNGLYYGVRLELEPNNPHDANAIAVYGIAEHKGWFKSERRVWHVGYLDRDLAAELHRDLISDGIPIAAELYQIFMDDDGFIDLKVIILAPPGHGHKVRLRKAAEKLNAV